MELTAEFRATLNETKATLRGYGRGHFMAQVVKTVFAGKASRAEQALGWNQVTLHKALAELEGAFVTSTAIMNGAAKKPKRICPTCWLICARWWTQRAKPTRPFKPPAYSLV
jgi:hypothetical protein